MAFNGNTTEPTVSMTASYRYAGVQISVDPEAVKSSFQELRFQTNAVSENFAVSKTAGFEVTKNYNISVTINPLDLSITDIGSSHNLQASTGGLYDIANSLAGNYPENVGVDLNPTVIYPSQAQHKRATGTFNALATGRKTIYMPNLLDTSTYPSSLSVLRYGGGNYRYFVNPAASNSISAVVDDETIDWDFDYVTFQIPQETVLKPGSLAPIPELSVPSLSVVGFLLAGLARRRRPVAAGHSTKPG